MGGIDLYTKVSTLDGVTVDPEYVIGRNKVWIFYYGKPVGQQYFDLHRCETPLSTLMTNVQEFNRVSTTHVSVYPNPASTLIRIEGGATGASELVLMNMFGQMLFRQIISTPSASLDVSALPQGTYYYRLTSNNGTTTHPILFLR